MPKNRALSYRSAALYLAGLINPYRKWYFIASGLAFVSAGTGLLNAKITQRLIDSSKGGAASSVILNAVLFAAIIAVNYFVARLGGAAVSRLAAGAVCDMKRAVAASLLRADYSAVIGLKAGDALSTANSDTQIITAFLSGDLTGLFSQLVMALGTAVCLLCIDPLLTAVTFAYTPLGLFFTLTLNRKMQRLYPVRADRTGEALSVIEQALAQIPVIKSFVLEKRMRDRVRAGCDSILETDMKTAVYDALLQPACASTSSMPRILFFLYAGTLVLRGSMTPGAFIAVFDLLNYIIAPSVYFPFTLNTLNKAAASMNRVKALTELPSSNDAPPHTGDRSIPGLTIRALSFGYSGVPLLEGLTFSHSGPGLIVIRGSSGRGKTTLLDLIAGLIKPLSGTLTVHGNVSAMQQDSFLFTGTVLENVLLGNPLKTSKDAHTALIRAGAENLAPGTAVGEGGSALSGGQRQRVALARTILSGADIWLLDEPTASIDRETERVICETLLCERSKRLLIAVSHGGLLPETADAVIDLDAEGSAAV